MARNPAFTLVWEDEDAQVEPADETPPPPAPATDRTPKARRTLVWEDDAQVDDVETSATVAGTVTVLDSYTPEYWRAMLRMRTEFNRTITRTKAPYTTPKLTDEWAGRSRTTERLQNLQAWREAIGWGHVG